jgi:hypothetical protein
MSPPSLVQQVWWRDRLDQQHDGVVLMVENFCSRASPTCSRERGKWSSSNRPAARVGRGGGCAPALPYIGGWVASLGPPPSPRAAAKEGGVGASFSPPSRTFALGFPLGLGRLGLRGLVHLAQVARTLPFRPIQASVKWAHNGPTPEPSRTFRYNTDKLRNFFGIQKLFSFI